jgi:hypothetical protein
LIDCLSSSLTRTIVDLFADKLASVLQSGSPSDALNQTLWRFVLHYMPDDGSVSSQQFADLLSQRLQTLTPIVRSRSRVLSLSRLLTRFSSPCAGH